MKSNNSQHVSKMREKVCEYTQPNSKLALKFNCILKIYFNQFLKLFKQNHQRNKLPKARCTKSSKSN